MIGFGSGYAYSATTKGAGSHRDEDSDHTAANHRAFGVTSGDDTEGCGRSFAATTTKLGGTSAYVSKNYVNVWDCPIAFEGSAREGGHLMHAGEIPPEILDEIERGLRYQFENDWNHGMDILRQTLAARGRPLPPRGEELMENLKNDLMDGLRIESETVLWVHDSPRS